MIPMARRMKIHRPPDFRGLAIGVCANGRRAGVYSLTARCGGIAGLTGVAAGWLQGAAGVWVTGMYAADVDNHESALLSAIVPARALAPEARNLARLLGAVAQDAAHSLDVLPVPGDSTRPGGRRPGTLTPRPPRFA